MGGAFRFGDKELTGIAHLEGRHQGETALVLCPGPTLADYDDALPPREWTRFAVDGAIEKLGAAADYWVVSDKEMVQAHAKHCPPSVTVLAMHEATTIIDAHCDRHEVHTVNSTGRVATYGNGFEFFSRGTLAIGAVEMARYMGFLRFFLVGLDLYEPRVPVDEAGRHRFDVVRPQQQKRAAQRLAEVKDAGLWEDVEVQCVGALLSQQDALPRLDWDEFRALTRGRTRARRDGELEERARQRELVRSLRNVGAGRILIVVASGPSVLEVDLARLKDHALIDVLSINTPDPRLHPTTYWAFCDEDVYDRHPELIDQYEGLFINAWNVRTARPDVLTRDNQVLIPFIDETLLPFSRNLLQGYVLGKSTTFANLQTALWMNYDKVFVFGIDMCRPPGAKDLHFQGGAHEMQPTEREQRFAMEAEHFMLAARHLTPSERSKFVFCSAYNPWPFVDLFGKLDHREAIEHILRLASTLEALQVASGFDPGTQVEEAEESEAQEASEAPESDLESETDSHADAEADADSDEHEHEHETEDSDSDEHAHADADSDEHEHEHEHAPAPEADAKPRWRVMPKVAPRAEVAALVPALRAWLPTADLAPIEALPPEGLTLADLDAHPRAAALAALLAAAPPEGVADQLGRDALLWAWTHTRDEAAARAQLRALHRRFGLQEVALRKARRAVTELHERRSAGAVQRLYDMLVAASRRELSSTNLPFALREAWTGPGVLPRDVAAHYAIEPIVTRGDEPAGWARDWEAKVVAPRKAIRIMLDAPLALGLFYRGLPRALVSVACGDLDALVVWQLQGVQVRVYDQDLPGKRGPVDLTPVRSEGGQGLGQLDWQRLLLLCAQGWARRWGLRGLVVRSGKKNRWTQPWHEDGKVHLPLEAALERYDAVAERLGFRQRPDGDWWHATSEPLGSQVAAQHAAPQGELR